eukprot:1162116-Pelagomonas_calceolata.AAC.8
MLRGIKTQAGCQEEKAGSGALSQFDWDSTSDIGHFAGHKRSREQEEGHARGAEEREAKNHASRMQSRANGSMKRSKKHLGEILGRCGAKYPPAFFCEPSPPSTTLLLKPHPHIQVLLHLSTLAASAPKASCLELLLTGHP